MHRSPYQATPGRQLTDQERQQQQDNITEASRNNILCHCKACGYEWVSSVQESRCRCGSQAIEHIACWQFPDG
ncbi:MAG: hypothetical protein AAFZ80_14055 [Cyanobacteria bacterium P01_A01_bin.105]